MEKIMEDVLLTYLKDACKGRERRVPGAELERRLGISDAELRKRVNRLRRRKLRFLGFNEVEPETAPHETRFAGLSRGPRLPLRRDERMSRRRPERDYGETGFPVKSHAPQGAYGIAAAIPAIRGPRAACRVGRRSGCPRISPVSIVRRGNKRHDVTVNSFLSWVGGKKALREEVIRRFPLAFSRYIEVFGGAGWVFFHKDPSPFEVYNDYNGQLVNLFHCVQEEPEALIDSLRYAVNSRREFEWICGALDAESSASPVKRAAWFYQRLRFSYAAGLKSYACQPHDLWKDFPLIRAANRRLKDALVENQDFQRLIQHYDDPESLFYCDPPYHGTEGYYQNIGEEGFTERDHIRLRDTLLSIQGKFLLSYNDDSFVRGLYDAPGIYLEPVTRLNNLRQRYEANCQFAELLIANYDMDQREKANLQLALF